MLTLPEGSNYNIVSPEGNVRDVIENMQMENRISGTK